MRGSEALARAAELAQAGRFRVEPNPLVGCVLVRRGRVVGEGAHTAWGGRHAEAAALRAAKKGARGATAYVTLEPCAHHGKTPPCADALIAAGVAEVVYAHADPNPATAGEGPRRLRAAGVRVRKARTPAAVRDQLAPYLAHLERKRPWIVAKWAMTLDGRIAARSGDSRWITAEPTRRWAHRNLRGTCDAILAGAGTVFADDPALTNRSGRGLQPLRVVVSGRRALPRRARVFTDGGRTLVAAPPGTRVPKGIDVVRSGKHGRVDLRAVLRELHDRGVRRLLVEGGSGILGSLVDRRLVDQIAVFVGPRIVGGSGAPAPVGGEGAARMAQALVLDDLVATRTGGPDPCFEGYVG